VPFDQRWQRFDEAVRLLKALLQPTAAAASGFCYPAPVAVLPRRCGACPPPIARPADALPTTAHILRLARRVRTCRIFVQAQDRLHAAGRRFESQPIGPSGHYGHNRNSCTDPAIRRIFVATGIPAEHSA
jgi:hypothetical protein